jgi:hypothetical protein
MGPEFFDQARVDRLAEAVGEIDDFLERDRPQIAERADRRDLEQGTVREPEQEAALGPAEADAGAASGRRQHRPRLPAR